MSGAITHYLHANRVAKEFLSHNKQFDFNEDAFLWGAQGPDFFFCHRLLPWQKGEDLRIYGNKIHSQSPSDTLKNMFLYDKQYGDDMLKSYLCGFLCHYSMDSIAHPFVRYGTSELLKLNTEDDDSIYHNEIESSLDIIMLRYETAKLPTEFNLKIAFPKNIQVWDSIAGLYSFLLEQLYGTVYSKELLVQALADTRVGFRLLNDRTGLKKLLIRRIERHLKEGHIISCHFRGISEEGEWDYANSLQNEWVNGETTSIDSFFDLYERAIIEALKLIDGFFQGEDLEVLTQNLPF